MLSDEQGIQAIIELQASVGVEESKENAKAGWGRMSINEKINTAAAHEVVCGGFDKPEGEI